MLPPLSLNLLKSTGTLSERGPILGMTPTQALTAIQTMADHSQKWHKWTSRRNVSSNSNTDGLAAIEVKHLEKVKYREFRRSAPFNGSNRAKFHVGPPGYYTRTNTRPPYGEKKPSLEELMSNASGNAFTETAYIPTLLKARDTPLKNEIVKVGHTNVNESIKKALLKSWVIDYFEEALDHDKDPRERSFDDYKWVFDLEIVQLANEYELGIKKKGHILDMIWENCKNIQGKAKEWWLCYWLEEDEIGK
ncbi:hypothetical protein Tco_0871456 [Tanacetum coccineum]